MAIIGALLGAGLTYLANRDKNDRAKDALNLEQERFNLQKGFADRLQELNRILMEKVQGADKAGFWDPEANAERAKNDTLKRQKSEMENLGAGLSTAGYVGNDSEVRYRLDRATAANQAEVQRNMDTARKGSLAEMIAAYNSTNPSTLQGAGSLIGQSNLPQMMLQSAGQPGNMGNLFASILPYIFKNKGGTNAPPLIDNFGFPGDAQGKDGWYYGPGVGN